MEQLKAADDSLEAGDDVRSAVDEAAEFLNGHLLPHAAAEEAALYPEVTRLMGSHLATRTMQVNHAEVGRLMAELGQARAELTSEASPEQLQTLRRLPYELYTLVRVHFRKEDIYLPLLDEQLSSEAAAAMFARMEQKASEARQAP